MKVQSAQLALQGERSALRQYRAEEQLQASVTSNGRTVDLSFSSRVEQTDAEFSSYRQTSRPRSAAPEPLLARPPAANPSTAVRTPATAGIRTPAPAAATAITDPEILYFKLLIEMLSGRDIRIAQVDVDGLPASGPTQTLAPAIETSAQYSVSYSFSEHYSESESTRFAATGTVLTDDGRELDFALSLQMERRFESDTRFEFSAGERKDPLVLNLAGNAAELSTAKYRFDLDADGVAEHISMATGGSRFLALDANGDGRIDDGRELFGALSGDGFADLARHDDDGNGFIDAGDAIFARLQTFGKDSDGKDLLRSLSDTGIGALYLGSAATPFNLNTLENETLGAVRRTGFFISDTFATGTLQQVDLVV